MSLLEIGFKLSNLENYKKRFQQLPSQCPRAEG
jgi:hypothetical protein